MPPNNPYNPDYSFITTPPQTAPHRPLPGTTSRGGRIAWAIVGLVVLLILFNIVKGVVSGPSIWPQFINIAEDQTEILHLASGAVTAQQTGISTANKNFALTTQATMTTAQANTLQYLKNNGHKVKSKQLNFKISTSLDSQLTTAAGAGDYDSTFQQIMQAKLNAYQQDLKATYAHTTGPKGKTLLSQDYDAASLLLTELQNPYQ